MQALPLGEQNFATIRQKHLLYIDKTASIFELLQESSYNFLSRPRRFGKSLLLSTLKEIFLGKKHLFEGLFIENKIQWIAYPIIHLDFSKINFKEIGLTKAIDKELENISLNYQISLQNEGISAKFKELIEKLAQKTALKVVILIDEYDKPITDYLENGQQAIEQRDILKSFYSIIKGSSEFIHFFFLTGISRFTKVSIFSELNHLNDLTFHSRYATICGYTQTELEHYFEDRIQKAAQENQLSPIELKEKIQQWYNGYSWDSKTRLYNPFSVLNFFSSYTFSNYWFESGTPTFLVKLLKKDFQFDLENIEVPPNAFNSYALDDIETTALLFQTGYLTIKQKTPFNNYVLGYPNQEVKDSMMHYLLGAYAQKKTASVLSEKIILAIQNHDFELFIQTINALFAAIPSLIFLPHKEAYYHSILFIALKLAGFYIGAEVNHSTGRLDAVLSYQNRVYILEFKLDQSAQIALDQIQEKNYAAAYKAQNKEIFLVGINFSSQLKKVNDWILV